MSRRAALYRNGDRGRDRVRAARAADRLRSLASTRSPCSSVASDPARLVEAARIGADFGYDEINLNCGCPSDRVQSGRFGACLMREPDLVAECVSAMAGAVAMPVTVKCRIGIDDQEPREALFGFAAKVRAAGAAALDRPRAQGVARRPEPEG